MDLFAPNDAECAFCGQTPASGAWGRPCEPGPRRAHWTLKQYVQFTDERIAEIGGDLRRAAYELERAAIAVEALPSRLRRKVEADPVLAPSMLRNEAERARDTLHAFGLLDV